MMLTKAEIEEIDLVGNSCKVRIPVFETSAQGNPEILEAKFVISPGEFNGYQVGDIVEIGFDNGHINRPIVIGKFYNGVAAENKINRGAIRCVDLNVSGSAAIPMSTELLHSNDQDRAMNDGCIADYNTIYDMIKTIQQLKKSVEELQDDNRDLRARIRELEGD